MTDSARGDSVVILFLGDACLSGINSTRRSGDGLMASYVQSHFLPASGSRLEAMQTNYANIRRLIGELS